MSRATVDSVCVSSSARLCRVSPISADLASMPWVISRPPSPSALAVSRVLRASISESARPLGERVLDPHEQTFERRGDVAQFHPGALVDGLQMGVEHGRRLGVALAELVVDRAAAMDESVLDLGELGAEIGGEQSGSIADLADEFAAAAVDCALESRERVA